MIQVVERACDILEHLTATPGRCAGSSEIAAALGISLQTANNLLRTLYRRGYLSQDRTRRYRLGAQCVYLGSFADRWNPLRQRLAAPLAKLVEVSGFTAFCGVLENDRLLCISLRHRGEAVPPCPTQQWWDELHSTASGRILLAALSRPERKKLLARGTRRKMTAATVVDPETLETLCCEISRAGYCEVRGESRSGVSSLAIPLRDLSGHVVASMALSAQQTEWDAVSLEQKLEWLKNAAVSL